MMIHERLRAHACQRAQRPELYIIQQPVRYPRTAHSQTPRRTDAKAPRNRRLPAPAAAPATPARLRRRRNPSWLQAQVEELYRPRRPGRSKAAPAQVGRVFRGDRWRDREMESGSDGERRARSAPSCHLSIYASSPGETARSDGGPPSEGGFTISCLRSDETRTPGRRHIYLPAGWHGHTPILAGEHVEPRISPCESLFAPFVEPFPELSGCFYFLIPRQIHGFCHYSSDGHPCWKVELMELATQLVWSVLGGDRAYARSYDRYAVGTGDLLRPDAVSATPII